MKTYLPLYFKKIGILFVFIAIVLSSISGIDDFRQGFTKGYNAGRSTDEITNQDEILIEPFFSDDLKNTCTWVSLLFSISGFLIYLFSKEKIDDEYIQQIRLKSILQALITTWFIYALIKLCTDYQFEGIYILQMQLIVYVILFKRNKNKELSEEEEIVLKD